MVWFNILSFNDCLTNFRFFLFWWIREQLCLVNLIMESVLGIQLKIRKLVRLTMRKLSTVHVNSNRSHFGLQQWTKCKTYRVITCKLYIKKKNQYHAYCLEPKIHLTSNLFCTSMNNLKFKFFVGQSNINNIVILQQKV